MKTIGKQISEERIKHGMTLKEMAKLCGIGDSHLCHIEKGYRFCNSYQFWRGLQNVFGWNTKQTDDNFIEALEAESKRNKK